MNDFNREIIVDFEAAQRDMTNLKNAGRTLQEASDAVQKLLSIANGMQGMTGTAIVNKAQIIAVKLDNLMLNLDKASRAINSAVEEKRLADAEAARMSQSGGI